MTYYQSWRMIQTVAGQGGKSSILVWDQSSWPSFWGFQFFHLISEVLYLTRDLPEGRHCCLFKGRSFKGPSQIKVLHTRLSPLWWNNHLLACRFSAQGGSSGVYCLIVATQARPRLWSCLSPPYVTLWSVSRKALNACFLTSASLLVEFNYVWVDRYFALPKPVGRERHKSESMQAL